MITYGLMNILSLLLLIIFIITYRLMCILSLQSVANTIVCLFICVCVCVCVCLYLVEQEPTDNVSSRLDDCIVIAKV